MRKYNLYSSIFLFLIGWGSILGGVKYQFGSLYSPGPGFLPVILGGILSLLSIGLFFTAFFSHILPSEKIAFQKPDKNWRNILSSIFALISYTVLLNYLGYALSTFIFLFYLFRFIGKKKWWISILIAALASVITYIGFAVALGIPLPKCMFIDWVGQTFYG